MKHVQVIFPLFVLLIAGCTKPTRNISQADNGRTMGSNKFQLPHTGEFKSSNIHAPEYFKNRNICAECHGHDFEGGGAEKSCKDCHNYPHPHKWALPVNHGTAYLASIPPKGEDEKKPSSCLVCHGENSHLKATNPEEFVSCSSCHTSIPHTEDFKYGDKSINHSSLARTYEGKCTQCHTDLTRLLPNWDGGCKDCHDEPDTIPITKWELPDKD